ncbi:hypothetical protein GXM_00240 [Nostoc sphaeroides CCNUC1]|uniref:Uncharacterized protein n=1 Tax=Nostoc sphaeroides CCNUC1 TaxID=2653204 RepID=A0A5P8VR04_9NOSO|nr:hypothetical protein GXM_00240 [Nostoc sphaeroides CCNUC1]
MLTAVSVMAFYRLLLMAVFTIVARIAAKGGVKGDRLI